MRTSLQDVKVITSPIVETGSGKTGGQIIGVALGWDYVAEHEQGIADICVAFGVPQTPSRECLGADARAVTKVPENLKFFEDLDGYAYLIYSDRFEYSPHEEFTSSCLEKMLRLYNNTEDIACAWSWDDFGIRIKNDGVLNIGASVLGQMYEAFKGLDILMFQAGCTNPFSRAGLVIVIRSRVPIEHLEAMTAADEDRLDLLKAVEQTGIMRKLEDARKHFYACSPRWIEHPKDDDLKSEHGICFWLNPMDQRNNNHGWFTVEQLLEWIDGKGPIPKTGSI